MPLSVQVVDTLPAGVAFVSATPSQGSCSQSGGTVTCPLGTIAAGANATVALVVTPNVDGPDHEPGDRLVDHERPGQREQQRLAGNDDQPSRRRLGDEDGLGRPGRRRPEPHLHDHRVERRSVDGPERPDHRRRPDRDVLRLGLRWREPLGWHGDLVARRPGERARTPAGRSRSTSTSSRTSPVSNTAPGLDHDDGPDLGQRPGHPGDGRHHPRRTSPSRRPTTPTRSGSART